VSDVNKKVDPVPVSVQTIIRNAVQGQANFATSSNIWLTATVEAQMCNCYALTHEPSVDSGMNNLISNAIRYTLKGGITVGVEVDAAGHGNGVRIIVTDTGSGIPLSRQKGLLEATVGATAQGAGIGLFTANQSIQRHANGRLELRGSEVGVGTVWCIHLLKAACHDKQEPASKNAKLTTGKADLKALFPGGLVLVDDDPLARIATRGALVARYGVAVRVYSSGQDFLDGIFDAYAPAGEACAAIPQQQHQPRCLILMDHLMPLMDGEQAVGLVPAGHPHVIAMMSGTVFTVADRARIRTKGVTAFFEKPLEWNTFDALVQDISH
jgi:signal transduction histidine kinase